MLPLDGCSIFIFCGTITTLIFKFQAEKHVWAQRLTSPGLSFLNKSKNPNQRWIPHLFHALQSGNKDPIIRLVIVPKMRVDSFASTIKIFDIMFLCLRLKGFEAYRHVTFLLTVIYIKWRVSVGQQTCVSCGVNVNVNYCCRDCGRASKCEGPSQAETRWIAVSGHISGYFHFPLN